MGCQDLHSLNFVACTNFLNPNYRGIWSGNVCFLFLSTKNFEFVKPNIKTIYYFSDVVIDPIRTAEDSDSEIDTERIQAPSPRKSSLGPRLSVIPPSRWDHNSWLFEFKFNYSVWYDICIKVHVFYEGHKNRWNLHRQFDIM